MIESTVARTPDSSTLRLSQVWKIGLATFRARPTAKYATRASQNCAGESEHERADEQRRVEPEERCRHRLRPDVLESLAQRVRDRDREEDRAGTEDAEPDDRVEPTERGQADVAEEVRLPEPVVALAPHPGERGDPEDRKQRRAGAHEPRTLPTRMRHLGERAPLLARERREARLPHRQGEEDRERDFPGPGDDDRQAEVDEREADARADACECGEPTELGAAQVDARRRSGSTSSASQASKAPLVNV